MDQELFSKLLLNFCMLLVDENVNVLKKVIQSSTQLYRLCIQVCFTLEYSSYLNLLIDSSSDVYLDCSIVHMHVSDCP